MTWQAVVEVWTDGALLYIPALPGFQVNASSPAEALAMAEQRIGAFLEWLEEGEIAEDLPQGETIEIAEQLSAQGRIGPQFESDAIAPEAEHCELALAVGRAALSDLLFAMDEVPQEHRHAAEQTLRHVAEMDRWYATRVAPANGTPFAALEDEVVQSASLFEETIDLVLTMHQPLTWDLDGESWSVRKALRRRTGHLREHLLDLLRLAG